jgi:hypothetical protein
VERLVHYWSLPQEAPAKVPEEEPEAKWPDEGRIEYRDVWMRYRPELDPVLKGGQGGETAGRGLQGGVWVEVEPVSQRVLLRPAARSRPAAAQLPVVVT